MERAAISGPSRWALVVLACLCAGAIVAAVLLIGPKNSTAAASSRTVTAERGVVQSTVTGSGTLEAKQTDVDFTSSGQLTEVMVHAGQHVVEGQALAKIDSTGASIALEQAQADLASAQAKLDQAEAEKVSPASSAAAPQQKGSNTGNSGSSGVSEATKAADIDSAQAGVDSAQASVDSAERTLSQTTLTAPSSGTVAEVNGSVGDTVSGGGSSPSSDSSSSGSGSGNGNGSNGGNGNNDSGSDSGSGGSSTAFIVLTAKKLTLQVPFSESDIGKIKRHQPATVTITALPGTELAAHVTSIDTLPTTNSGVTSYNVNFALDQTSHRLRSGMSASAQVVVSRVNDALNLPSAAISRGTVQLVKDGKTTTQQVTTGIVGDSTTQIISGLKAGDQVSMSVGGVSGLSSEIGNALRGRGSGTLGGGGFGGGGGGPQVVGPGGGGGGPKFSAGG
jgi:macrolide-specific efflux system membrane fusion protein